MGFWEDVTSSKAADLKDALTLDDLLALDEKIRNAPPHPCRLGQHVVASKALYRPGWYVCGNCGAPVEVTVPLSEL